MTVHLHAKVSTRDYCDTVCGEHCDAVRVAYRDVNAGDVTCATCLAESDALAALRASLEPPVSREDHWLGKCGCGQ